jgi:tetratricopeptide (TPR) repeat protein
VDSLFAHPLLKADVLARISDHKGVSEKVRHQALELADRSHDDAERFHRAARGVVRYRDAAPALYRAALSWVQTACRLAPDDDPSRTTLGIAEFRRGQPADALATLTRAMQLNETDRGEQAADLAFLATAHQRLGHPAEARAARGRLAELMKTSPADWSEETRQYLSEVESVLGKAGDAGK